jgi:hypothetical protein
MFSFSLPSAHLKTFYGATIVPSHFERSPMVGGCLSFFAASDAKGGARKGDKAAMDEQLADRIGGRVRWRTAI